jgi:hypothetical protein
MEPKIMREMSFLVNFLLSFLQVGRTRQLVGGAPQLLRQSGVERSTTRHPSTIQAAAGIRQVKTDDGNFHSVL